MRVQVKVKADKQLWEPVHKPLHSYSLGWNTKKPAKYFERDFEFDKFGFIESPPSYRCDLFLFGWHGLHPGESETERVRKDQSIPNEYDFFIASASELKGSKARSIADLFSANGKSPNTPWTFEELPEALNNAADRFLRSAVDTASA